MSKRATRLPKPRAGIYEAAAPTGYTDRSVVDQQGELLIRVFVRADVARDFATDGLLCEVLDTAKPSAAPRLKIVP